MTTKEEVGEFVKETLKDFAAEAERELTEQDVNFEEAMLSPSLDIRYVGQSYEISVSFKTLEDAQWRFHESHSRLYGYSIPSEDAEIVNIHGG